jgi:hypothetical protein
MLYRETSAHVPSPIRPRKRDRIVPGRWAASLEVLAPTNATTPGAPCCRRPDPKAVSCGRGSPNPRRCRPQGSCPSRRFGLVMLATRTGSLRTRPCAVAPDASRPCFMPLASLERPSELSLPEEPYPLSRASCFLAGFALRSPPAQSRQEFTSLSPQRQLFALTGPPGGGPRTHEPGPRFPATLRSAAKTRP